MRIGQFAQQLGDFCDSVRRLEKRGLLAPKRDWGGHRRFTEAEVARIKALLFNGGKGIEEETQGKKSRAK